MAVPRDKSPCSSRSRSLARDVRDIFVGLSKASGRLPGGGPALLDDIHRTIARISVERTLAADPPPGPIEDPAEALRYYLESPAHANIVDEAEASAEKMPKGRLRVKWKTTACLYCRDCGSLEKEGHYCVCPFRLFYEQAIACITGKEMSSIACSVGEEGYCGTDIFPVSSKMLRPIERIQRNAMMTEEETRAAQSQLDKMEAQHKLILETIGDAIVVVDREGKVTYMNPRACGVFAVRQEDVITETFAENALFGRVGELCVGAARKLGKWEGEATIENRDGGEIHNIYHTRFSPMRDFDGSPSGTLIVLEDVTREELLHREIRAQAQSLELTVREKTHELRDANAKLEVLAGTDPLTRLANRRMFEEILGKEITRAARQEHAVGVLMADVDDFKEINDLLGHQKGDEILVWTATLLLDCVRDSDTVARWGGDEFIILLPGASPSKCKAVAGRMKKTLASREAALRLGNNLHADLSIGWASGTSADVRSLIAAADDMMYARKAEKKAARAATNPATA